jgi:hypothetical protein
VAVSFLGTIVYDNSEATMKKLRLELDMLEIQCFATTEVRDWVQGTLHGYADTKERERTCDDAFTCGKDEGCK